MTRGSRPPTLDEAIAALKDPRGDGSLKLVSHGFSKRTMPAQKPGRSIQTYSTPIEFIDAVQRRFRIRMFAYDLAASIENTKAKYFFCEEEDSLKQDWSKLSGPLWLNPPFGHIEPWAEKCKISTRTPGRTIYFLTPASVGASWFARHVWRECNHCCIYALEGRLSFDGIAPYPKDCMLTVFSFPPPNLRERFDVWDWRKELNR